MDNSANSPNSESLNTSRPSPDSAIDWSDELESHRGWMRKVLRCRIGQIQAVEDCLQEIAVAISRQEKKPTDAEKVPGWLYRLAVRQAVNFHRKTGRHKNLLEGYTAEISGNNVSNQEPLDWLIQLEQQELVRNAMSGLRATDREILSLKYTEHWNYKQLAQHLGVSTTTIEYRLVRAKKRLRQALANLTKQEMIT